MIDTLQGKRDSDAREKAGELQAGEIKLDNASNASAKARRSCTKGPAKLHEESTALPTGLEELQDGTFRLANGISRLQGGSETLQSNLADGFHRSYPLQAGLQRASVKVTKGAGSMSRRVDQINTQSPGLFDSGYFVLSAIDGAPPADREQAGEVISLRNGGQGAAITVISNYTFNTDGSTDLDHRLKDDADGPRRRRRRRSRRRRRRRAAQRLRRDHQGADPAGRRRDHARHLPGADHHPPGAAAGGDRGRAQPGHRRRRLRRPRPALQRPRTAGRCGGHTYVDAVGAMVIFGVVFGLSIDYAVFLLMRMREHYDQDGDNAAAISFGLEKTARRDHRRGGDHDGRLHRLRRRRRSPPSASSASASPSPSSSTRPWSASSCCRR